MKYSTLWLSLLAAMSAQAVESKVEAKPEEALYSGYSLWEAQPAKTKKWACDGCEQTEGWTGEVGVGAGYGDNDGATRFNNWVPTQEEQGMAGIFNADAQRQDGTHYTKLKAKDVGLERFGFALEAGKYDGMRMKVGYSETPYYWSNDGKTVYHGDGNVLQAGSLDSFDKQVMRKKVMGELAYTPKSPWRPHASFSHEKKEGTLATYTSSVPGVGSVPGLAPKPIESNETTLMKAGISYQAEQWLVDVSYNGSLFRNDDAALYYQNVANQTQDEYALEPNNDFHQLALSGQYQLGNHFFNGRVLSSHATSSGSFNAFTASPTASGFEGEIDTFQADGRWVGRLSQKLTMRANAEYRDRDDKSDRDVVAGDTPDSTDRSHTKAGFAADYRLGRGLKLTGGYDYLAQTRDTSERENVDENTIYVKTSFRPAAAWQFDTKLAFSSRDGSDWSRDDGESGTGPSLRPFYLADRDRTELTADLSYQISDDLETTANVWYAQDEYVEGDIGRSEGEDYGYDLGLNYRLTERTDGHLFINQQRITSSQNHANSDAPGWNPYHTDIADQATTFGLGLSHKTESDIEMGLDYSYSVGKGETNASAGVNYDDNSSKQHRVELYSTYPLSENQSLRWDLRYESFEGEDFLLTGEEANMGDLNDDYDAYFTSVSWLYKF